MVAEMRRENKTKQNNNNNNNNNKRKVRQREMEVRTKKMTWRIEVERGWVEKERREGELWGVAGGGLVRGLLGTG